ncbi:MAG: hypothetical protein ACLUE1_04505 [Adlercreutzia equolifaciens]
MPTRPIWKTSATDAIEICKKEQADGIIASFSDLLAECMIDIADAAGLPSYLKPEGEKFLREKPLMKQMFQELGIASPRYKKIRLDTLEDDFAGMAFPCVIKPVNGYGSHGCSSRTPSRTFASAFNRPRPSPRSTT